MVRVKRLIIIGWLSSTSVYAAKTSALPDIALLEFLGTTAGLESMGVNLDKLLQPPTKPSQPNPQPTKATTIVQPQTTANEDN